MMDLKEAILDAKYVDLISLGDFIARDCGIPVTDSAGNALPQASELAAAMFRWAAGSQPQVGAALYQPLATAASDGTMPFPSETASNGSKS